MTFHESLSIARTGVGRVVEGPAAFAEPVEGRAHLRFFQRKVDFRVAVLRRVVRSQD